MFRRATYFDITEEPLDDELALEELRDEPAAALAVAAPAEAPPAHHGPDHDATGDARPLDLEALLRAVPRAEPREPQVAHEALQEAQRAAREADRGAKAPQPRTSARAELSRPAGPVSPPSPPQPPVVDWSERAAQTEDLGAVEIPHPEVLELPGLEPTPELLRIEHYEPAAAPDPLGDLDSDFELEPWTTEDLEEEPPAPLPAEPRRARRAPRAVGRRSRALTLAAVAGFGLIVLASFGGREPMLPASITADRPERGVSVGGARPAPRKRHRVVRRKRRLAPSPPRQAARPRPVAPPLPKVPAAPRPAAPTTPPAQAPRPVAPEPKATPKPAAPKAEPEFL